MTYLRVAGVRALWTWSMSDQGFTVGLTLAGVRALTDDEMDREGCTGGSVTLELADGTVLFAARDCANNEPGAL